MGKIAFVFSGQGDQFSGMGKDLYDTYQVAKNVFDSLDNIRVGTSEMCFYGCDDDLKQTKNTQPCLFAMEMAGAKVLCENNIKPSAVAGFSLGEVVAMTFSGAVSLQDGFNLVIKRGLLMHEEALKYSTSMVAVVKLSAEQVINLAKNYTNVYPVNFNCPGQVSVAGECEQIKLFSEDVKNAGGRAIPLKVAGAFHSPYMQNASDEFKKELDIVSFNTPQMDLYSNLTANVYDKDIKNLLANQISNPVKWEQLIKNMIKSGIDTFIEIGPGKTLTNMISKIDNTVKAYSIKDLQLILSEVKCD